jgi:hypothetical protein
MLNAFVACLNPEDGSDMFLRRKETNLDMETIFWATQSHRYCIHNRKRDVVGTG